MSTEMDDGKKNDLALLEAALFLASKPLSRHKLARILQSSVAYVDRLLDELGGGLSSPSRGIELYIENGRVILRVKRPYIDTVAHLSPHQDIPHPILRSLAMIAYNHPMTQADLVKARGNKAYGHVQELLERRLIRGEDQGRTILLYVTDEFLRHFGLKNVEEFRFHVEPPPTEEAVIEKGDTSSSEDLSDQSSAGVADEPSSSEPPAEMKEGNDMPEQRVEYQPTEGAVTENESAAPLEETSDKGTAGVADEPSIAKPPAVLEAGNDMPEQKEVD